MTIGSIFRGAWALIKANPGAIIVWSLINLAMNVAVRLGSMPFLAARAANAAAVARGIPPRFPPIGAMLPLWAGMILVMAVL